MREALAMPQPMHIEGARHAAPPAWPFAAVLRGSA